jgi:hypothetical protein
MLWWMLAGLSTNTSTAVADSLSSCRKASLNLHSGRTRVYADGQITVIHDTLKIAVKGFSAA